MGDFRFERRFDLYVGDPGSRGTGEDDSDGFQDGCAYTRSAGQAADFRTGGEVAEWGTGGCALESGEI
jgi:hypothetical protein